MRLTERQAAIIGAYIGTLAGPVEDLHEYIEHLMGRPVWTHELPGLWDEIKRRAKSDFLSIAHQPEQETT